MVRAIEISGVEVHGRDLDASGRCFHYGSPADVVCIRHRCCGRYYACHRCHDEAAGHRTRPWPADEFGEKAVLCGACGARITVREYLASADACPRCRAPFNPRCSLHHPLYFETVPTSTRLQPESRDG